VARRRPLTHEHRRRRLVAGLVLALCAAVAAGVASAATRHSSKPAAPPTPPPPPKPFRIIFPEGFTRVEMGVRVREVAKIAERERHKPVRLNETAYLAASKRARVACFGRALQRNLEGFLFPATYEFLRGTTSRRLVQSQLEAFCTNWRKVDLRYARSKNLTPYDVLTIASMVEEEAQVPSERPLIAAVIYNRLHERMPLGIDATLRYGLHIKPTQSIKQSQLASSNPYNTRRNAGLPPTPIGNPGLAAIRAAAHPAHVDYLYYVRKPGTHRHFFTASGDAFNQYLAAHGYGPHS
jgi:UPF0755 protein